MVWRRRRSLGQMSHLLVQSIVPSSRLIRRAGELELVVKVLFVLQGAVD